jgi:hypothetical protein
MHTLALSNDTSIPAYCSMIVSPDAGRRRKPTTLVQHHQFER